MRSLFYDIHRTVARTVERSGYSISRILLMLGISRSVTSDRNVNSLMIISGIGIYSSAAIMSEIADIRGLGSKEKHASYALLQSLTSLAILTSKGI